MNDTNFCWYRSGGGNKCEGFALNGENKSGLCCRFDGFEGKGDRLQKGLCKNRFDQTSRKAYLQKFKHHVCVANGTGDVLFKNKTSCNLRELREWMQFDQNFTLRRRMKCNDKNRGRCKFSEEISDYDVDKVMNDDNVAGPATNVEGAHVRFACAKGYQGFGVAFVCGSDGQWHKHPGMDCVSANK